MTAKGSKNCCCGGCTVFPTDASMTYRDPAARLYVNQIQTHCCACIPVAICVSATCVATGEIQSTTIRWGGHNCINVKTHPELAYIGSIGLNGKIIDLKLLFNVTSGYCLFALQSVALGMTGYGPYDGLLIDAAQRAAGFCTTMWWDSQPIEWVVSDADCGAIIIRVSATDIYASVQALTPITRRQPCEIGGIVQPDNDPIKNLCVGCGCVATTACITVLYSGGITYAAQAILIGTEWTTSVGSYGTVVALVRDPVTGGCALQLVSIAGLVFSGTPAIVPISANDPTNPCPFPKANWLVDIADGHGGVANVQFSAGACQACEAIQSSCCNSPIPRQLSYSQVATAPCACATFTLPIVYDQVNNYWYGQHPTLWCGHEVDVTMPCDTVTINAPPCILSSVVVTSKSCYPFRLAGTGVIAGGLACCGAGISGAGTFTWVITEA